MNENKNLADATKIAQFRFALIAPVIQGLFPDASRTAYYKRVTEKPLTLPDGSVKEISYNLHSRDTTLGCHYENRRKC